MLWRQSLLAVAFLALALVLALGWPASTANASTQAAQSKCAASSPECSVRPRRALVLYSYSDEQPWQQRVRDGLADALGGGHAAGLTLFEERLDALRLNAPGHDGAMARLLDEKYRGSTFDIVISEGQNAGEFLLTHPELFANQPSFVLNYAAVDIAQALARRTGHFVSIPTDLQPSIELIARLFPNVRRVVAIADETPLGRRRQAQLQALTTSNPALRLEIWSVFTETELLDRVRALPTDAALLYFPVFADREGRRIESASLAATLGEISPVPVFTRFDVLVASGVLGGHVVSARKLGELIAELAIGGPATTDGTDLASRLTTYYFDDTQLLRWGVSDELLPNGSVIANRREVAWRQYRGVIAAVLVFIVLQSILVIALARNVRQRQRALAQLAQHQIHLEQTVAERTRQIQDNSERLDLVLAGADLGMWDFDLLRRQGAVNERFYSQLGWPAREEPITRASQVYKYIHAEDIAHVEAANADMLAGTITQYSIEFRVRHRAGHWVWIQSRGRVTARDDLGVPVRISGTHLDITERKAAEAQVWELAFYDPLTQLPNRRLLMERLQQAQAASARSKTHCALLFIDLDRFKWLNDTHGHETGDQLLKEMATRLTAQLRQIDTVGRLGGDEFVVLLQELSSEEGEAQAQAQVIAAKLRVAITRPFDLGGLAIKIDASIGISTFCGDARPTQQLLNEADQAMYKAKALARGGAA